MCGLEITTISWAEKRFKFTAENCWNSDTFFETCIHLQWLNQQFVLSTQIKVWLLNSCQNWFLNIQQQINLQVDLHFRHWNFQLIWNEYKQNNCIFVVYLYFIIDYHCTNISVANLITTRIWPSNWFFKSFVRNPPRHSHLSFLC